MSTKTTMKQNMPNAPTIPKTVSTWFASRLANQESPVSQVISQCYTCKGRINLSLITCNSICWMLFVGIECFLNATANPYVVSMSENITTSFNPVDPNRQ